MKSVSFQLFILLVQIYLASKIECRSSDGQEFLIETESGEVFRSQPSKKDTEEAGHDYADDYDDGVIIFCVIEKSETVFCYGRYPAFENVIKVIFSELRTGDGGGTFIWLL